MIRTFIIFCVVVVCATATMPFVTPPPKAKKGFVNSLAQLMMEKKLKQSEYRLPCNTKPHVYIIDIDPDFLGEQFTFNGIGTIIFEVLRPTTTVTLHRSDKMDIDKRATQLIDKDGSVKTPVSQKWNPMNDFFSIKFNNKLKVGNYTLKMSWTGRDGADDWYSSRDGLYRAADRDDDGNKKYLITTHFEATGARRVFPCWDEPGMKAQFEFSIKHYPNYTALSNMPVKSNEKLHDGRTITKFERSLKMSPYLPCLAVADYKHIENANGNITFYTLERAMNSLKYALDVSEKVIPAMEFYTDVPYAFPKLDQITIPQYPATAMEHWGLVSYVTSSVTLGNDTLLPDIRKQERIELLVAHELAHQWFGNLVTPIWWNDVWLNEAFADYFQYKVVDLIFPERRIMDTFVVTHVNDESFQAEKYSDKSKPIKWNPVNKIEIDEMFSAVTYAKGGGVLHMLDHMLGEEIFRDGIRRYLKAHQFTAVITDDLWDDLQEAYDEKNSDKSLNIKEVMDPWIEQTGYPIITVTRDNETGDVILTQKNAMSFNQDNKWTIPLNYATKSNPDFSSTLPTLWFNENDDNVTIPNIKKDDWIILNIQQSGFYRVHYDVENWQLISDYLTSDDFSRISPINRAQLITDAFEMVGNSGDERDKYLEILLNITSYLHRETDYLPWIPAMKFMHVFTYLMKDTALDEMIDKYILFLMSEVLDHVNHDYIGMKTQQLLFPLACRFGHAECLNYAQTIFNNNLGKLKGNELVETANNIIICYGLAEANETIWESLIESFNNTKFRSAPYHFLSCSKSEKIRNKYLNQLFTTNITDDLYDIITIFNKFHDHRENVDYILNYFINNFELIEEYFDKSDEPEYLISMVHTIHFAVKTRDQYEKFKAFLQPRAETLQNQFEDSKIHELLEEEEEKIIELESIVHKFYEIISKHLLGPNAVKLDKN